MASFDRLNLHGKKKDLMLSLSKHAQRSSKSPVGIAYSKHWLFRF